MPGRELDKIYSVSPALYSVRLSILFCASVPPIEIVIDGTDNINTGELTHARLPKKHLQFQPPVKGRLYRRYLGRIGRHKDSGLDSADGEIKVFDILAKGYTWVDIVAYDHYAHTDKKVSYVFSPFSHDGEASPAPEPATMMLMGFGLLALAGVARKNV